MSKNPPVFPVEKTEAEWRAQLSPEQYDVLREQGTERPFSGKFNLHHEKGTYHCAACGNVLFSDEMKFESHCGWPSFDREIKGGKILQRLDKSHGMLRTEIVCAQCGGHLGHIFNDGITDTGMRYCVNSLSLEFSPTTEAPADKEQITLGGGCYWCIEAVFQRLRGVEKVESGFSGGFIKNPAYREVCNGNTGHAEVVQITFDTSKISLEEILQVFFSVHDPTTLNRQGGDVGTQYRSVIFYHNEAQHQVVRKVLQELEAEKVFDQPIVTQVQAFEVFYKAEDYHQNYFNDNGTQPYCQAVVRPKVEKFQKVFKEKLL